MQLTRLAGNCPDRSTCPTIYATDRGTVVVQGHTLLPAEAGQIGLPAGGMDPVSPYAGGKFTPWPSCGRFRLQVRSSEHTPSFLHRR